MPRPRPRHGRAASVITSDVNGPYDRGRNGPGGWWIVMEPGVWLATLDVEEIVPDVAGWRRERMPELPEGRHGLTTKRPIYAEAGVRWMWIVDVDARTLTASRNHEGRWLEIGVWSDADLIRAEPFDAVELRGEDLWGSAPILEP